MEMKNQKKDLKWIWSQQRAALENTVGRHKKKWTAKEKMNLFFMDILVFISPKYQFCFKVQHPKMILTDIFDFTLTFQR